MKTKDMPTLEAAAAQLAAANARADAAEARTKDLQQRADAAEGRVESLEERIKQLESSRIDEGELNKYKNMVSAQTEKIRLLEKERMDLADPARLRKAVKERVSIEAAATLVLGPQAVTDSMDDRLIMTAVIEKLHGNPVDAERSDDYVRARFDAAVEGYKACADTLTSLASIVTKPSNEPRVDSQSARQKMIERNQNAWKSA